MRLKKSFGTIMNVSPYYIHQEYLWSSTSVYHLFKGYCLMRKRDSKIRPWDFETFFFIFCPLLYFTTKIYWLLQISCMYLDTRKRRSKRRTDTIKVESIHNSSKIGCFEDSLICYRPEHEQRIFSRDIHN